MSPVALHTLFEALGYVVGFQTFRLLQHRAPHAPIADRDLRLAVIAGAILGAALGSKLAYWIDDPLTAFAGFPDPRALMQGKSIVGGLLGGLIGVELAKKRAGVRESTGDAFALPLIAGMIVGRVGCHLAGVSDHTAGLPVAWGWDYGDGAPRHPTALYEIAFLALLGVALARARFARNGDRFRAFMVAYLAFRFVVEFLKPVPFAYFGALSGLQLLCVAGLAYYHRDIAHFARETSWRTS